MIDKLAILVYYLDQNGFEKEAIAVKNLIPLFVYGTLRDGEKNHHMLEGAEFLGNKILPGFVRTEGIGPAIIPGDEGDSVEGELYQVEPEALEKIDEYEGDEYPRELVRLEDGTEVSAYIYRPKQKKEPIGLIEKYIKHTALNLGQAARDIVSLHDHPAEDNVPESIKHRLKQLANNLYYAIIPPWTHHTGEELQDMARHTVWKWFLCGYMDDEYYEEECL